MPLACGAATALTHPRAICPAYHRQSALSWRDAPANNEHRNTEVRRNSEDVSPPRKRFTRLPPRSVRGAGGPDDAN